MTRGPLRPAKLYSSHFLISSCSQSKLLPFLLPSVDPRASILASFLGGIAKNHTVLRPYVNFHSVREIWYPWLLFCWTERVWELRHYVCYPRILIIYETTMKAVQIALDNNLPGWESRI